MLLVIAAIAAALMLHQSSAEGVHPVESHPCEREDGSVRHLLVVTADGGHRILRVGVHAARSEPHEHRFPAVRDGGQLRCREDDEGIVVVSTLL